MKTEYPLTGGVTRFRFAWPYLARSHVVVLVDTTPHSFKWIADDEIEVTDTFGGPALGAKLTILRVTPDLESYARITDASSLTAEQLNQMRLQLLYLIQERAGGMGGYIGAAVGAVTNDLQDITSNLDNIKNIIATLTAGLVTLNTLRADILFAKNEAAALRDELLAEINSTTAQFTELKTRIESLSVGQSDFGARISQVAAVALQDNLALALTIQDLGVTIRTDKAELNASITRVDQARSTGDTALAERITSLEASIAANNTDAITALINEEARVRLTTDQALAQQALTLQAAIGGQQLASNGKMIPGARGYTSGVFMSRTAAGVPPGAPSAYVVRGTGRDMFADDPFEVTVGEVIDTSVWIGLSTPSSHEVGMVIFLFNDAGAVTAAFGHAYISGNFTGWRQTGDATFSVPAGVSRMQVGLWINQAGSGGDTTAYFTNFSVQRHSRALAQVEQQSSASVNRLGVVESNYTIKTQARTDGKNVMAGIGLAATAGGAVSQSEIIFMADRFVFVPPGDVNAPLQPLLVAGTVNGVPTTVYAGTTIGDKTIGARVLVDGAIETRHLRVVGGGGSSIWFDPGFQDPTAWTNGGHGATAQIVSISDGVAGDKAAYVTTPGSIDGSRFVPVVQGKRYRVSVYLRKLGSNNSPAYVRLFGGPNEDRNAAVQIFFGLEGFQLNQAWTRYTAEWVCPAGIRYVVPRLILNWVGDTPALAQDFRIEEMIDSSLVVTGGISADRIDTRGLTIKDLNGNVILGAGTALSYASLGGVKPPVDADRTATNVAAAVFGQGIFATLSKLTPGNISTYMDNAAIGSAQIGYLAVKFANIEDLTVGTQKITGGAASASIASTVGGLLKNTTVVSSRSTSVTLGSIATSASGDGRVTLIIGSRPLAGPVEWSLYHYTSSISVTRDGSGSGGVRWRVRRNGTIVFENAFDWSPSGGTTNLFDATTVVFDQPGAGVTATYTYEAFSYSENVTNHAHGILPLNVVILENRK